MFYTLKVTNELQWTKNGKKYNAPNLECKKPAQSESELIRVAYVISKKVRSGPEILKITDDELRGGFVRGDSGNCAVFTMQCASASHRGQQKS